LNNTKSSITIEQLKLEADVGPLKYVAELIYGDNAKDHFDSAVRIIILILIFVFDPLAVLLLIAANISLRQWKSKREFKKNESKIDLSSKYNKLKERYRQVRRFKNIMKEYGDDPDEIKLKLSQIYDFEKNNPNNK